MSKFKYKKMHAKNIKSKDKNMIYYDNVLLALGLSKTYILYNNYYYFGNKDISNQGQIKSKFKKIEIVYNSFLEKMYKKYDCETIILELGVIYTKLQKIHLCNDELLGLNILTEEETKDISYPAKMADLMARKVKTLMEIIIKRDNHKFCFRLLNADYKKLVILLYYYSTYIFYDSRSKLSKDYENGITDFYIFPNTLEPICTMIQNQENSVNDNGLLFNYNSNIGKNLNADFNKSFFDEKGITFENYANLMQSLLNGLDKIKQINGKIDKEKLIGKLKQTYPTIDIQKFENNCILSKSRIEYDEKDIFKNNCKHRLDTTPIIDIGNKHYIINEGIIWNSRNFWNNVHSIGLIPYTCQSNDKILKSLDGIISEITLLFEKDIIKALYKINPQFNIYHNKKTKDIFKNRKLEENEWDIIAVDYNSKYIFDIEAKFLSTSMTESGLSNDLKKIVGNNEKSYKNKFEKRINIENDNMNDFLSFCNANNKYNIIHIMVTSKIVDLNIESNERQFLIIHYEGLEKYILSKYYS